MPRRKRATRKYTDVEFGYDDGRVNTVMLMVGGASVTLQGEMLDKVTASFFSLHGYGVSPGIRAYKLKKSTPWKGHNVVTDNYMSATKGGPGRKGPLHFTLSTTDGRLRLWIQSTVHPHFHLNINFSKKDAAEFGRRLAEAAGWDVE